MFQSGPVTNSRGKKNLVLSGWGDESLLSEQYINPYFVSSNYQSYSEQTQQNLVSIPFKMWIFIPPYIVTITWPFTSLFYPEKIERRCDWLWPSWRSSMFHWWNLWGRCHTCILTCKTILISFELVYLPVVLFSM